KGTNDAHTLQESVRNEQRRLGQKEATPGGLRRFSVLASLLLGHSPTAGHAPSSRLARTENRRNKRGRIYGIGPKDHAPCQNSEYGPEIFSGTVTSILRRFIVANVTTGARLVSSRSGDAFESAVEWSEGHVTCGHAVEWDIPRSEPQGFSMRWYAERHKSALPDQGT